MDLNQLLYNHQIALMRGFEAAGGRGIGSPFDLVGHYERRIAKFRAGLGVSQYPMWSGPLAQHGD